MNRMAALLGLALLAVVPLPAGAALPPAYGGELRVAAEGPLEALDGAHARSDAERTYAEAVHCSLPELLSEAPVRSEDGRRLTLRLRPRLFFHDGTRLTAEDVARSLMRLTDPGVAAEAAWRLLAIEGVAERLGGAPALPAIRAEDDLTLVVDLAVPGADLVALLDDPRVPVVRGRIGCGPFRPAPGAGATASQLLVPFDRHPRGRPFLDRLVLEPTSQAGHGPRLRADVVAGDAADAQGETTESGAQATFLVVEKDDHPPGLAQSLAPALDRRTIARLLAGGGARPLGLEQAEPAEPTIRPDRLTLRYDPARPAHRAVAERIQLRLYDAGITVRLVTEGAADLALIRFPVSSDPAALTVAALLRLDGPAAAREALQTLADTPESSRPEVAARLLSEGPAVPLYLEPGHLRVEAGVMGAAPGRASPVAPASLWIWPLTDAPPPSR